MMDYRDRIEWINARIDEYVAGQITESVFRASLYGKGRLRGEELMLTIRDAERLKHDRRQARANAYQTVPSANKHGNPAA